MKSFLFSISLGLFMFNQLIAQNAIVIPFIAEIQLNDRLQMQVTATLEQKNPKSAITIYNGKEVYQLSVIKRIEDTIVYQFPAQDAEWRIAFDKDFSEARGWWVNYNKKAPVRYPIHLYNGTLELSTPGEAPINIEGKWRVAFNQGTPNEEILVGVFEQKVGNLVTGSFLSETGDYRYLHGYVSGRNLHLQTYTGYWAFVVDANIIGNDQFEGTFYSGAKYQAPFEAKRDSTIKLRDESSLTYLIKRDEPVYLNELIKLNGRKTSFNPVASGKISLIQIMGTWCPNCLDETQMLIELQNQYGKDALNVMALAYEVGSDTKEQRKRLKNWVKSMNVNYTVYLAGSASKEAASSHFPMLNGIMSFPTTLLIDQQGKIIAIHTGFSGPATGSSFTELVDKYKEEIEGALEQNTH